MPRRIALITDEASLPDDYDMVPLVEACQQRGLHVEVCRWDEPGTDWSDFTSVVVRSPWSYTTRLPEFLSWCERVNEATSLVNPLEVIRWTLDKTYLRDLAQQGVRTVPTAFVPPGALPEERQRITNEFLTAYPEASTIVVKPSIGAYSRGVQRFAVEDRASIDAYVATLAVDRQHALVQPYLESIDDRGESDLIFFNGIFSHAIRKAPLLQGKMAGEPTQNVRSARTPTSGEVDLARAALEATQVHLQLDKPLLYARVDLVTTSWGQPAVLELELCEPSLSLMFHAPSAQAFATAIATRIVMVGGM